jgi:glutamate synthase domain-containing protein 2
MRELLDRYDRFYPFAGVVFLSLAFLALTLASPLAWVGVAIFVPLSLLGVYDVLQKRHAILRNYPVLGHMRFLFEGIRPEIRQYLMEGDQDEEPFSREDRALVYQRAKDVVSSRPFGTKQRVYEAGFGWVTHSVNAKSLPRHDFKVKIGGPDCKLPYDASLYNISAMSFGSLSGNAIRALNEGARLGGFAHDTGEGGISVHHRSGRGDLIWEIGSAYFGCRTPDGRFEPERFARHAAEEQVKMIEVKLSQGAKPGKGGILPAAKITREVAEARGIPMGIDCVSPPSHPEFSTPLELCAFLARLRQLSGGKPVGFKLCIGHRREFMCMVKAMLETGVVPDFIVVDGKEGGTGAAPLEFANHVGMPLVEGLSFVHNTLRGAGLRAQVKLGAAGKLIHAYDIARALAIGADWANSARGFMFAVGCIQAQTCHTNTCPVGVATQDPTRERALVVPDKAQRVAKFHGNTLKALAELAGAAGLDDPRDFLPRHFIQRQADGLMETGDQLWPYLPEGFLLRGEPDEFGYAERWARARAESFDPPD